MISEMSRLSVSSSNSLRRCGLSPRKRARSLGRLGELAEDGSYQYEKLSGDQSTYWQDRIQQVHRETGSPTLRALQRVKAHCHRGSEATPPTGGRYARSEEVELRQRSTSNLRAKPAETHLPDLLSSSTQTPRRPRSAYDLKVSSSRQHLA